LRSVDGRTVFSPTDLVGFLACEHLTQLDRASFVGFLEKSKTVDEELQLLIDKGLEHETRYLGQLAAAGLRITEIQQTDHSSAGLLAARSRTIEAMQSGVDVIYQATFIEGGWSGQADFLRRVDRPDAPSRVGPWVYEPEDTKLALSAKAGALVQLLTYARMIEAVQGVAPEQVHVVLGREAPTKTSFRVADYAAYHRLVSQRFEDLVIRGEPPGPEILEVVADPVEHCGVCAWASHCGALRYRTGHLSRVSFIRRDEVEKLRTAGVPTIWALGGLTAPRPRIAGLTGDVLDRLTDQAAMQLEEARTGVRFHRILEHPEPPPARGLLTLPEPSPLDIFFDFEGDRFALDGGLEYLFGWVEAPAAGVAAQDAPFSTIWAHDRASERQALETFVDYVVGRRATDPGMHVYHYAPYEPTTLHRLTQRHDTRQEDLDVLLRAGVFVDLYRAVRQGVRVSSESYSIKRLEPLYDLTRDADGIAKALSSMIAYERWLRDRDPAILDDIAAYNRDDCISTLMLRDWLEERRVELVAARGVDPGRPLSGSGEASEERRAVDAEVAALRAALTADIPAGTLEAETLDPERQARRLLGNLLGWHRREARADWYEWFRLRDLGADDLVRDATALGVSRFDGEAGSMAKSKVFRWRFDPQQETKLHTGDEVVAAPELDGADLDPIGTIVGLDLEAGEVTVKVRPSKQRSDMDLIVGFLPGTPIRTTQHQRSLAALGRWVADHGIDADGPYRAVRDVLLRRPPRLVGTAPETPLVGADTPPNEAARGRAIGLDQSCLAIQGPPGSGKTHTGAAIVLDLLRATHSPDRPRVVGITAFSHAAISNLLREVARQARGGRVPRILQKADPDDWCGLPEVERAGDNKTIDDRLAARTVDLVAGTTWLWSRPDLAGSIDTLIVDEAGQIALANLAAIGRASTNLVLLGDPRQLSQPLKGAHPIGADKSALEHLVGDHDAIPDDLGIFLAQTRRLHPAICAFTSELFYEGRLQPLPGLERQAVIGPDDELSGSGLRWMPVRHVGRSNASPEEAAVAGEVVRDLMSRSFRDRTGAERPIRAADILVVSPYNAQVALLRQVLPTDVRAGTVDKFQGQEAPVVIYSMATSTPDDMPRDMTFLFSQNRFNVATSRAQALVVLVCNPMLLTVACKTPDQMRLANALARFVEFAGAATELRDAFSGRQSNLERS
jgi:predicted RecB family nuclease